MKRILAFIAVVICAFEMGGCIGQEKTKEWSEQEILTMFESARTENWDVIDCVLMPDNAYGLVGAVLFFDDEKGTTNVAFFDKDGYYQQCGTYAKSSAEADFLYLGNGAVSYKLMTDDDIVYNYVLTISIDGDSVHFKAEDDLMKQQ